MTWVRVDDAFYDHRKFDQVTVLGIAVWITGLSYANRNLTDGFIPTRVADGLVSTNGLGFYTGNYSGRDAEPSDGVSELVAAGLWHECEGGYRIHDYHDYQPSAEQVRAERDRGAGRQAAWRERTRNARSNARSNAGSNAVTNGVTPPVSHAVTDAGQTAKALLEACPTGSNAVTNGVTPPVSHAVSAPGVTGAPTPTPTYLRNDQHLRSVGGS